MKYRSSVALSPSMLIGVPLMRLVDEVFLLDQDIGQNHCEEVGLALFDVSSLPSLPSLNAALKFLVFSIFWRGERVIKI